MKRIKLLVGFLVGLLILGAMSAPTVSAQALNDVWLKCKVDAKAFALDLSTGAYKNANGSRPVYLHFVGISPRAYSVEVWTLQEGTQTWLNRNPSSPVFTTTGENFIPDFFLKLQFSDTDYIVTRHTPLITYKGGKVTYKGTGEIDFGEFNNNTTNIFGYFNIHGTSVDPSKLPFTP